MNLWSRLGISVALLGIFCILCSELMLRDGFYDNNRSKIAAVMGGIGVASYLIGRTINKRRAQRLKEEIAALPKEEQEAAQAAGGPFILANLAYWGPMLISFALVVVFIPAKDNPVTQVVARTPPPPKKKEEPPPATNAAPVKAVVKTNTFVFPTLKLQGITQRGGNSSALINGQTYFVGEQVGPVKIVSIFANSVVVECNGEMRSLTLGN